MASSGTPLRPNPPTRIVAPFGMSAQAERASGKTLFTLSSLVETWGAQRSLGPATEHPSNEAADRLRETYRATPEEDQRAGDDREQRRDHLRRADPLLASRGRFREVDRPLRL